MKRLYILMRNDMDSLCPGKAIAQGSHATSIFHEQMKRVIDSPAFAEYAPDFDAWEDGRDFGTTITLKVTERELKDCIKSAQKAGHMCAVVEDPTYPISDGITMHQLSVKTCGYIFCTDKQLDELSKPYYLRLYGKT